MSKLLGPADFEPHVGSDFELATGSGDNPRLTLASVQRHPQQASPRTEPFSLLFVGDLVLDQRIHQLRHQALGDLEIFLVPIGPDPSGTLQYEAVFN